MQTKLFLTMSASQLQTRKQHIAIRGDVWPAGIDSHICNSDDSAFCP